MSIVQQRPEAIAKANHLFKQWAKRGTLPMIREKVRPPLSAYKILDLTLPPLPVDRRRICAVACTMFGITLDELRGRSRKSLLVDARQYAAVRLRQELGISYPQIGRSLGARDHSSIYNLVNYRARK